MIEVTGLAKSFGDIRALDDFSCLVRPNAITALTGADGAGKSTFFKILVGLLRADRGLILLEGRNIAETGIQSGLIGYMPESFSLYPDLSVAENLDFFAAIHGLAREESRRRRNILLERTGMSPFTGRRVSNLSGGMKQKLALMAILLASPRLLILDEPTTGVDPRSRSEFFSILQELRDQGCSVLLSTPYLDEAEKADYVVLVKKGRVLQSATPAELKQRLPARIFRLEPRGNPLQVLAACSGRAALSADLYVRGRYLVYMQSGRRNLLEQIPHERCHQDEPRLEDVYIYYERRSPDLVQV